MLLKNTLFDLYITALQMEIVSINLVRSKASLKTVSPTPDKTLTL